MGALAEKAAAARRARCCCIFGVGRVVCWVWRGRGRVGVDAQRDELRVSGAGRDEDNETWCNRRTEYARGLRTGGSLCSRRSVRSRSGSVRIWGVRSWGVHRGGGGVSGLPGVGGRQLFARKA